LLTFCFGATVKLPRGETWWGGGGMDGNGREPRHDRRA
jgi:hypothetical protein